MAVGAGDDQVRVVELGDPVDFREHVFVAPSAHVRTRLDAVALERGDDIVGLEAYGLQGVTVAYSLHDHLICAQCNLILEFENQEIEDLQDKIAERLGGFRVVRHKLELYCLCPKALGIKGGRCPNDERQS